MPFGMLIVQRDGSGGSMRKRLTGGIAVARSVDGSRAGMREKTENGGGYSSFSIGNSDFGR